MWFHTYCEMSSVVCSCCQVTNEIAGKLTGLFNFNNSLIIEANTRVRYNKKVINSKAKNPHSTIVLVYKQICHQDLKTAAVDFPLLAKVMDIKK